MFRRVAHGLPLLGLWVVLGSALTALTASVRDWNAMTDELVYERLAISIAQTHSVLPQLHGEVIRSLAQLYPLLISPWFLHGYVPEDLRNAHIFNAWLMSSACIPAFFLARRVTERPWAAYLLAFLAVCTPWIIYSTTLLTEVAAYPAFLWAILAMQRTITAPSLQNDVLAVGGLALAFFARTQFIQLAVVLPAALVAFELHRHRSPRRALRASVIGHPLLTVVYAVLGTAVLTALLTGHGILNLSVYGSQASGHIAPRGDLGPITGHVADLAFGIGILPFLVGSAWMLANLVVRSSTFERQAFACIASIVTVIFMVEITQWDLHIGNFVLDRYLFYLAPLLLLAFVCALLDGRRPRWSLIVPTALVGFGFATHLQEDFLWSGRFPLSTDSPIAWLYKPIADLGGGTSEASAILVTATILFAGLFVLADRLVRPALLTACLCVALALALPADTALTFDKLFSREGHSYRPLTRSESGILDWLDRALGSGAHVTEVPYPISDSFLVSQEYWRDLEFWNKSVRYAVHYPTPDVYRDAVIWFPNNAVTFDETTGKASDSLTPYVAQSVSETRFRISGTVRVLRDNVMVIQASTPWRTDWLTSGLYDDGWTRPRTTARIRVFAAPGQRTAVTRTLTVQIRLPPGVSARPVTLTWGGRSLRTTANADERIEVCVPPGGFADVRLSAPVSSEIPGDQRTQADFTEPRSGGVFVAGISVADEIGPRCRA